MIKATVYRASNKLWYVKITGRNGEKIWKTGDGYERKSGALKAINLLRKFAHAMPTEIKK